MSEYLSKLTGKKTFTELHDAICQESTKESVLTFGKVTVYLSNVESEQTVYFGVSIDWGSKRGKNVLNVSCVKKDYFDVWQICETLQNLIAGSFDYTDKFGNTVTGRLLKDIDSVMNLLTVTTTIYTPNLNDYCKDFIKKTFGCDWKTESTQTQIETLGQQVASETPQAKSECITTKVEGPDNLPF